MPCPVSVAPFLLSPFRKLFENPNKILKPLLKEGMKVLEVGPAMGFFTLPMASMIGKEGKIYAVDFQEGMLTGLMKRAEKQGLQNRIETILCAQNSLNVGHLKNEMDFILTLGVAHEVDDLDRFFSEIYETMKPEGIMLLGEPKYHVKKTKFQSEVEIAEACGFKIQRIEKITCDHAVIFEK
jgi:ubiquinone/menaquinone biosynthesis C-methylase UbiE